MSAQCSNCSISVNSQEAYFSDAGDALCQDCFVEKDTQSLLERGEEEGNYYADVPEGQSGWGQVIGGLAAVIGAAVWFGVGWMAGRIYFYPPILALIGLFMISKGGFALLSKK